MSTLRRIRQARGLSQPALAKLATTSQQQIDRLEKGQRPLTLAWARRLAPWLGVPPHELDPVEAYATAVVRGYVRPDEEVFFFEDRADGGALELVAAPPGEHDIAALRVEGDGLSPRYLAGEIIFYSRACGRDLAACLYADCVVHLCHGSTLLKRVEPGSERDAYILRSYNPAIRLLVNCKVEWIAPIMWRGARRCDPSGDSDSRDALIEH